MKKNNSKKIIPFVIVTLAVGTFFFVKPKPEKTQKILANKIKKTEKVKSLNKKSVTKIKQKKTISRSIASIPSVNSPNKKREIMGKVKDMNNLHIINKYSKDWKKKYISNFKRMSAFKDLKNFEIEQKSSVLKVERNVGRKLEHIIVRFVKPNGRPFSFEALVDSQTGQMVQSWNKTRDEIKDTYLLNPTGKEVYAK